MSRPMSSFVKVASLSDLPPGSSRCVEAGGKEIAIHNVEGRIYACSNICPHQGGPMADGILDGTSIVCPWHAWAFDLESGCSPVNPRIRIDLFAVKIENGEIFVNV